jgi:hypothetical protein
MTISNWHLGANDPDFLSWLTTVAYLATAGLCVWRGVRERGAPGAYGRLIGWLWLALALAMLLLGINKQLDLQTPLLAVSRKLALAEGWYRWRRAVQWVVIGAGLAGGFAVLAWLWRHGVHAMDRSLRLALLGLVLLLLFVAVRAAPVRVDQALGIRHPLPGKRHLLELGGIACIAVAGTRRRDRPGV